jgi:hypothetical protein
MWLFAVRRECGGNVGYSRFFVIVEYIANYMFERDMEV